jgi:peptide/nickel transport system permease protein
MQLLARRLGVAVLLFWLVLTITFALVRLAPGDAATLLVPPSATAADAERLRAELGLDASIPVQYARWIGGALRGDFGESFVHARPVVAVLADAIPLSLGLGFAVSLVGGGGQFLDVGPYVPAASLRHKDRHGIRSVLLGFL